MNARTNTRILIDAIESIDFEARSYSGRGMYGRTCTAMVIDGSPMQALTRLIYTLYGENDARDVEWLLENMDNVQTDNMGLSTVVYWPDLGWEQDDE